MTNETTVRSRILDIAIMLAEAKTWEAVRLQEVASRASLSLEDIRAEFREKDELIDAWFERADRAMLTDAATLAHRRLARHQRMHRAIMTWLGALAGHRRVTRQMVLGKLEPGHLHLQIPALMRISRTVQWMREAAGYQAVFPRRALEETVHTSIYLATFSHWMFDDSPRSQRTHRFLHRQLKRANPVFSCGAALSGAHGAGYHPSHGARRAEVQGDRPIH
jgi:AcrR family transcriptional regulator